MYFEPHVPNRRWLVANTDGQLAECRVIPLPDDGGDELPFATDVLLDGALLYSQRHATRDEAEHDADEYLRGLVATGWE